MSLIPISLTNKKQSEILHKLILLRLPVYCIWAYLLFLPSFCNESTVCPSRQGSTSICESNPILFAYLRTLQPWLFLLSDASSFFSLYFIFVIIYMYTYKLFISLIKTKQTKQNPNCWLITYSNYHHISFLSFTEQLFAEAMCTCSLQFLLPFSLKPPLFIFFTPPLHDNCSCLGLQWLPTAYISLYFSDSGVLYQHLWT